MKDQYFGDINDYRKYGLLRALLSNAGGRLLVAWMLTPDDGGRDGRLRSYLEAPQTWRNYDPELFDGLADLLRSARQPSVSLIRGSTLLPRSSYYSAVVPDARPERDAWFQGLLCAATGAGLIFLDPDNGIEVPSRPVGRKRSSKYVMWQEVEGLWSAGYSLLIYQHFRREKRETFPQRLVSELGRRTGAQFTKVFRTPRVLFLMAAQHRHVEELKTGIGLLSDHWRGQIEAIELANKPLQPTGFASG